MTRGTLIRVTGATVITVILVTTVSFLVIFGSKHTREARQDSEAWRILRTAKAAASVVASDNYYYSESTAIGAFTAELPRDTNGNFHYLGGSIFNASAKAIAFLQSAEPTITFQDKAVFGELIARRIRANSPGVVWVQTNETPLDSGSSGFLLTNHSNPNGFTRNSPVIPPNHFIPAGSLIRMGIISASGNSFCTILVMDSLDLNPGASGGLNIVSGEGWQSVSAELTQAGYGADCGAEADPTSMWYEMPNTSGTDPKPSGAVTSLSNDPVKAKAYSE